MRKCFNRERLMSRTTKSISKWSDLALNGAEPAFEELLHVGRPNIGDKQEFLASVADLLDRSWLTNDGPLVQQFERAIAEFHSVKHCISTCNGTIALEIAIRALGLEGEVIVPSFTFIATAHALSWQGITPVFADIDPATHNLDPDSVRSMITPRTTGLIGVHLWGRPAPVEALSKIADEHGLKLMFDAAHAFGTSISGTRIGTFGSCEVLSFHATKIMNSFEGGAILTNDDNLANTARLMRNFGFAGYDNVIHPGTNGKLTEICAAMGLVNLKSLDRFVASNKCTYERYADALGKVTGIRLIKYEPKNDPNYHYIVAEVERGVEVRNKLVEALHAENVLARRYFWPGCHGMMTYNKFYPHAGMLLPNTTEVAGKILVLPNGISIPEGAEETISRILDVTMSI
jgi:dTDP-4-amino-4,6-dideoxygalactose transaminase